MKRRVNKQKLIQEISGNVISIHKEVEDNLEIDRKITDCIANLNDYDEDALLRIHLKLFLDYSEYTIKYIHTILDSFKLVDDTKQYRIELMGYEKGHKQLSDITRVKKEDVANGKALFGGLVELADILEALVPQFKSTERRKFIYYFSPLATVVSAVYIAVIQLLTSFPDPIKIALLIYLPVILAGLWLLLRRYLR